MTPLKHGRPPVHWTSFLGMAALVSVAFMAISSFHYSSLFCNIMSLRALRTPNIIAPEAKPPKSGLPPRSEWSTSSTSDHCKALVRDPKPNINCRRNVSNHECSEDGSIRMYSQYSQDFYLFKNHFSKLNRRGIYVDIATHNPIWISNTYFFDACLGWTGLCVEADPSLHEPIGTHRSCHLFQSCLSDKEGSVENFLLAGGLGGITTTNKFVLRNESFVEGRKTLNLTCSRFERLAEDLSIRTVDYLSLDVEGHEVHILRGINWDKIKFNVMTVEATNENPEAIVSFLLDKGYKRHLPTLNQRSVHTGLLTEDMVFLHESVEFGNPV